MRSKWMSSIALSAVALSATATMAQTAAKPAEQTSSSVSSDGEIIVTANKRAELLSKTSISVSALTKAALDSQGIKDVADIARTSPGLTFQVNDGFGNTNISIRGISSRIGAATTGIYIDETPVQMRIGNELVLQPIYSSIFDLERVEVLRGPQGTLYGSGSEGGTVRYLMTQPSVTEASGTGRAELATTKNGAPTYEIGAAIGFPVIDDVLGIRASAWQRREGGWIDRIPTTIIADGSTGKKNSNSRDLTTLRLALLWQPSSDFSLSPSVMYQRNSAHDTDLNWVKDGSYQQEYKIAQPVKSHYVIASNTMKLDVGTVSVSAISSYLRAKGYSLYDETYLDGSAILGAFDFVDPTLGGNAMILPSLPDFFASYETRSNVRQFSQELRFASNDDDRFNWTAGLYYQHTRSVSKQREFEPDFDDLLGAVGGGTTEEFFGVPLLPGGVSYLQDIETKDWQIAGFANATIKLVDRLKLELGVRYAKTSYDFDMYQDGPWNGGPLRSNGKQQEKPFTPKIGLAYDVDGGLIYANAAKGYRIGGANASLAGNAACANEIQETFNQPDVPRTYSSDSVWSYEVGAKGRALDRRINFAASAYWVDWKGIQSQVSLKCFFNFVANVGTAVSRGFDFSVNGRVTDAITLGADIGYNDARYSKDYNFNGTLLAKKDDQLPTPPWTVHVFADVREPMGANEIYGRVDYTYNSPYNRLPSATVKGGNDVTIRRARRLSQLSTRLGYRLGEWDVSLFVDNVLNDHAEQFRTRYSDTAYYFAARPRPRTIGVTVTMRK
jgi:iron complex outermembrane recepter protein